MLDKMIGKKEVKNIYNVDTIVTDVMSEKIELWGQIYTNKSPWLTSEIKSLNLGAAVSSEMARLVTIEMESLIEGSPRAEYLQQEYDRVLDIVRQKVELGLAKGGIVLKPYVNDDEVLIDYVQAESFFPITISNNGVVTEAVFVDRLKKGDQLYYNKLEYHKFDKSNEYIYSQLFKSSSANILGTKVPLQSLPEYEQIVDEITFTGLEKPLFAYFKNPMSNTIEPGNPMGQSVFEKATEQIEEADKQWSRFLWENESAERALDVDSGAFRKDPTTGYWEIPHGKERLFRRLESIDSTPIYHDWSPDIRNEDLLNGLDAILRKIEFNCGLAYGTISDPQSIDKTATEVKQARQRSWSTIRDIQKQLKQTLKHTVYVMDYLTTIYNLAPSGKYEISFVWDDSIITDKDSEKLQDQMDVTAGLMAKYEYRMKWYGETEDIAKQMVAEIQGQQPQLI